MSYIRFCAENRKFSLPWQQAYVRAKYDWHSWIGRPWKPYLRTKNYVSILYTTEVMANFLVKFPIFRYHGNRPYCYGKSSVRPSLRPSVCLSVTLCKLKSTTVIPEGCYLLNEAVHTRDRCHSTWHILLPHLCLWRHSRFYTLILSDRHGRFSDFCTSLVHCCLLSMDMYAKNTHPVLIW